VGTRYDTPSVGAQGVGNRLADALRTASHKHCPFAAHDVTYEIDLSIFAMRDAASLILSSDVA
jgi:hypothetical protein